MRRALVLAGLLCMTAPGHAGAAEVTVSAGSASLTMSDAPWSIVVRAKGSPDLVSRDGVVTAASGVARSVLGVPRLVATTDGGAAATVRLSDGTTADLVVRRLREGVIAVSVTGASSLSAVGLTFAKAPGERLFGTGERSDAVDRSGRETENYVADGPYPAEDRLFVAPTTPPWAVRDRDDATYFPVPWVLTSTGWGVLTQGARTSRLSATNRRWAATTDGNQIDLVLFAGPRPAGALRRFTAFIGRQPAVRAPWAYGPWFQTGQPNVVPLAEELSIARTQRDAGAPVSAVETQMHFLPCGAQAGREQAERERTDAFHATGLARLVYFNPLLCLSYSAVYKRAAAAGVLQQGPAGPFLYPAFVGGSGPLGFTEEPLAQFDFTAPGTEDFYAGLVRQAVDLGADGWMEDFGESTPPLLVTQHDGSSGDVAHNRYPTDYHCALQQIAGSMGKPLVRFQRSGWTGSARCADVVWGGDPTTRWGFDGLSSAITQLLSIGMSGLSRWGTDIGGYDSFGAGQAGVKPGEEERLTPELLTRWMEFGALVPVMRTKRTGLAIPSYDRPQVFDKEHLPIWRRLTELHLQLNGYLREADAGYRRTGMPIARHLALVHPADPDAVRADDEYLLGGDLLAAPVTSPGIRERSLYVPRGIWLDWWRSTRFDDDGTYRLAGAVKVTGPGRRTIPAPLGRPPLLLRAGALIGLLSGDVDTLSPYAGKGGLVRASDRASSLHVIGFPRGSGAERLGGGARAKYAEGASGLRLTLDANRRMNWDVDISLAALRRPFTPRSVSVGGRVLKRSRWHFDGPTRVLEMRVRTRQASILVRPRR